MITGGSVAEDQMGGDKVTTLETALNKNYKIAGFDNFKVIVGAMAGWRQPNQLIMMALYNHIIHGFISLDGFNEFELIEAPNNRMAGFPADPFVMQGISNTLDVWKYLFARCDGALFRHELNSKFLIQLRSYYYTIEMIRQACRYKALELSTDKSSYMTYFTFSNEYANEEDQKKHNEKIFLMYIRSISAIAKANHIRELYFIQPTPAFKKVLTEEERLAAQDLSYKPLYEKMIRDRLALVSENIPVVSLANIFKDDTERVFRDRIHLNDQGREALEKNIIISMERQWNIQKK